MNAKISLRARWVLPINSPPIAGGFVTIEEGCISSVSAHATDSIPVRDLGDVVLMPALINAHTHLEFSQLQQPLGMPGMPLPEWIRLVISDRKRATRDVAGALSEGMRESLALGVTTLGEIATASPGLYSERPEVITFQEVIGFSAARLDSVLADVRQRLENCPQHLSPGLSPHAPYTVHFKLLAKLIDLAVEKRLPVAMHLAESQEELQLLAHNEGPLRELLEERSMWDATAIRPGTRPLDYLQALSRASHALIVHGNYLEPDEINFLAEHRESMAVVYCPRTHDYFGHPTYRLEEMLRAGVRVVLGTDSRASNPDLSLLSELRYVHQHYPKIPAEEILKMGTLSSAVSLGQSGKIGSLAPGKLANLLAVPWEGHVTCPAIDVLQSDQLPCQVWLRGELIKVDNL